MTTAVQVQYRRGAATQIASFTGAAGEMVVDTTNNRVVIQDGGTAGGWPAAKLSEVQTNTRTQVNDGNYTALTTDRTIAYITLTASRTIALPAAASYPTGSRLLIVDESGNCSAIKTLTLSANGSDLIDGASSAFLSTAYGYLAVECNGANKWTVIDQVGMTLNGLSGSVSIVAGDGAVVTASGSTVTMGGPGGMVNKFHNGTMDVWQRGTSGTATTTAAPATQTGPDGWYIVPTGASVNWAQASGRLTTKNSLQVTGATSVTDVIVKQRIESLIAAAFCSQTVTYQAQVYNGTGGAITPKLSVNRATGQDNGTYTNVDVNAVSLQSCPSSSWTQVSYTFAANAGSYNGLEIVLDFGNNFGANTKTVQLTECDIRVTPGASIGLNSAPPPPELRPVHAELAFCQRYAYSIFPNASSGVIAEVGQCFSSSTGACVAHFPVTMRAVPTLAISAASDFQLLTASAGTAACTALIIGGSTSVDRGTFSATVASGLVAGNATFLLAADTAARATFSAEL
jgi:hypothetical protein